MSIAATPSSDLSVASAGRPSRPGILTAIAVIEGVTGAVLVLCGAVILVGATLGMSVVHEILGGGPSGDPHHDASMSQMQTTWLFMGPILLLIALGCIAFGTAEIAAGIGLWRLKSWGVSLTKTIAWLSIVGTGIVFVFTLLFAAISGLGSAGEGASEPPHAVISEMGGHLTGLSYWIVVLVAVSSKHTRSVVEACAAADRAATTSGQPK